jgi:hypothetical protein
MQTKYSPAINAKLLFPALARQWLAINRKLGSFSALLLSALGWLGARFESHSIRMYERRA